MIPIRKTLLLRLQATTHQYNQYETPSFHASEQLGLCKIKNKPDAQEM